MTTRFTSEEGNMRPLTQARINGSRSAAEFEEASKRFPKDDAKTFYEHWSFQAGSRDSPHLLLMMKDLMQVESRGNPSAWSRYSSNSTTFATSPGSWFS